MGRINDPDMCPVCDTRACQSHPAAGQDTPAPKTTRPWWRR